MKNFIKILLVFIISFNLIAVASDIELQPTMNSRSNVQDRVWTAALQVAWKEFIFKSIHNPVRFREGTPVSAQELNNQEFSQYIIPDKVYYKFSGNITKNTVKKISKVLKKRFDSKDDSLCNLDSQNKKNNYIVYVFLKKDFNFLNQFDKLGKSDFGKKCHAEYFGINSKTETDIRNNITVLFYNNSEDFAIKITENNDEIYIYKNSANKSFQNIYNEMNDKINKYKGNTKFEVTDELKIPFIKFNFTKNFTECTNKRIMGTNLVLSNLIETINFRITDEEQNLNRQKMVNISKDNLSSSQKSRHFYYNSTFVIFIKEQYKTSPYFALRIHNIENYQ